MQYAPRGGARLRLAPATTGEVPSVIGGRYQVKAALGEGGVARVFRVTDAASGAEVALKHLTASATKRLRSLFELEYQTLASLRHPHVVQAYEYGRDASGCYYTMELLEGEDLRARAPMPWREVCAALRDAAAALGVLHARRLIHRDVSPRNLWRVPDGRVKLIDFGALASFGMSDNVIGTPPLVPPEALQGQALDQRADLYALGASAYFLLTGRHAYQAHDLRELELLWQVPCLAPSATLGASDPSDPTPAELDALVLALIHRNPLARPSSTVELIDRVDALLGGGAQARNDSPELHLDNPAFIGRERERRRLRRLLRLATAGRGQCVLVECESGMGRSRLLHELALEARVADSNVLHVDAASYPGMYGTAAALASKLLDALPEPARSAAAAFSRALGHVDPQLRERLDLPAEAPPDVPGELRVRVQAALRDWFLKIAEEHLLVVIVDGLERADDGSVAFLHALSLECKRGRLLLACAVPSDRRRARSAAERGVAGASFRLRVGPLTEPETFELLHSVFGNAVHLARLTSHLHSIAHGNPGHVLELAAQLVRSESIRFTNGMWVLPQEPPETLLPRSRKQALAARLVRLDGAARALGRVLAVASGALDLALCCALAERPASELAALLENLCDHEIMTRSDDGLRFSHELFRTTLLAELTPQEKQRAQRALGTYLLRLPELGVFERLQAGLHLLESGDLSGASIAAQASTQITLREPDQLAHAVPLLERALLLFRQAGRPSHELLALLPPLAIAGFFVDRRYAVQHGPAAVALLQDVLGMKLALRLRPYLGRGLALIVALSYVTLCYVGRRRAPNLQEALVLLFMTATALAASSGLCYDFESTRWAADVLEPFGAFGSTNAAGFSYEVSCGLADATLDDFGKSSVLWHCIIARLESKSPIPGMPDNLRVRYLSGLLFSLGMMDSQRDDDRALVTARRLDEMGAALYPMNTDQLRTMYYGHQGNAQLYRQYRELSERCAIQQGAIWQNETWALLVESVVSHRHHDTMAMKRVAEQLRSASKIIPTLSVYADRSRGTYLLMRERYAEALVWLECCLEEPMRKNFGWGRSHGVLARAYNGLGRYADARAACARVLDEFTAQDLEYAGLTLLVETEHLVAQAGLGDLAQARRGLATLLDKHVTHAGPLTHAELHETGVRIALLTNSEADARNHFQAMRKWYGATDIPSLVQHCEAAAARIDATFRGRDGDDILVIATHPRLVAKSIGAAGSSSRAVVSRDMTLVNFTTRWLRAFAEQSGGVRGYLYTVDDDASCSLEQALGHEPLERAAERWMLQCIAEECVEQTTAVESGEELRTRDFERDRFDADPWHYRLYFLWSTETSAPSIVAVAVMGNEGAPPKRCPPGLLQAMAAQLSQALELEPASS